MKNFYWLIYLIISFFLSAANFLSFKVHLYNGDIYTYISFVFFQIFILLPIYLRRRNIIFANILVILLFTNIILIPINFILTKDVPILQPDLSYKLKYINDGFFDGMFSDNQEFYTDELGYRPNKKNINYKNKINTLRVFTIGGSTTANMTLGNNNTWSSILGNYIQKNNTKNIEVINTGVSGLRSMHNYLTFKRILKLEPDLVIFLLGINDWNHQIKQKDKYLFPSYEIRYDIKHSLIYKFFSNIKKVVNRKIAKIKKNENHKGNERIPEQNLDIINADAGDYFLKKLGNLYKKKQKEFRPLNVSKSYSYWINQIVRECNANIKQFNCLFLDQPTSYSLGATDQLKNRMWMTPPNENYTLSLENMIHISSIYNKWLKNVIIKNNLPFFSISKEIPQTIDYFYDDCHYTESGAKLFAKELAGFVLNNPNFLK